jgi:hypothetical protein
MPLKKISHHHLRWSTSSFGCAPGVSATDQASLGAHMLRCDEGRVAFFRTRRAADSVASFAAPRLFTMLALFALAFVALFTLW